MIANCILLADLRFVYLISVFFKLVVLYHRLTGCECSEWVHEDLDMVLCYAADATSSLQSPSNARSRMNGIDPNVRFLFCLFLNKTTWAELDSLYDRTDRIFCVVFFSPSSSRVTFRTMPIIGESSFLIFIFQNQVYEFWKKKNWKKRIDDKTVVFVKSVRRTRTRRKRQAHLICMILKKDRFRDTDPKSWI